jgi:hypothetical protein
VESRGTHSQRSCGKQARYNNQKQNKDKTRKLADVTMPADGNVTQREGVEKKTIISENMYRDKAKMEKEMYDHTDR